MKPFNYFDPCHIETKVSIEDVFYYYFDDNQLYAMGLKGQKWLVDTYITALESSLPIYFVRIKDEVIVNKRYVREVLEYANKKIVVVMNDIEKTSFIVSDHYYSNAQINLL